MKTLYDYLGNPIDLSALRSEQAGPTLTGHPADGLTPSRLARLLREAESCLSNKKTAPREIYIIRALYMRGSATSPPQSPLPGRSITDGNDFPSPHVYFFIDIPPGNGKRKNAPVCHFVSRQAQGSPAG